MGMSKFRFASERARTARISAKVSAMARQIDRRELQRAFWLFAIVASALFSLIAFAASSHGKSRKPASVAKNPNAARAIPEPCKDGLKLSLSYGAVNSVSGTPAQRYEVQFKKGGAGEASSNIRGGVKNEVSPSLCQAWQKHAWPHVDRMIAQSKLKSRGSFQCINVARLSYELGGPNGARKKNSSNLCLGSARQDAMSNAFYQFLDQTAVLAKPQEPAGQR